MNLPLPVAVGIWVVIGLVLLAVVFLGRRRMTTRTADVVPARRRSRPATSATSSPDRCPRSTSPAPSRATGSRGSVPTAWVTGPPRASRCTARASWCPVRAPRTSSWQRAPSRPSRSPRHGGQVRGQGRPGRGDVDRPRGRGRPGHAPGYWTQDPACHRPCHPPERRPRAPPRRRQRTERRLEGAAAVSISTPARTPRPPTGLRSWSSRTARP
ncbi:hypothetical protein NKG05_27800 [Oerskovia sp. M15]